MSIDQLFFLHSTVIGQFLTLTASSTTATASTAHCRPLFTVHSIRLGQYQDTKIKLSLIKRLISEMICIKA